MRISGETIPLLLLDVKLLKPTVRLTTFNQEYFTLDQFVQSHLKNILKSELINTFFKRSEHN